MKRAPIVPFSKRIRDRVCVFHVYAAADGSFRASPIYWQDGAERLPLAADVQRVLNQALGRDGGEAAQTEFPCAP